MKIQQIGIAVLLTLLSGFVHANQDDELAVKRYRQVAHAYISRAKARTQLPEILREQAKKLSLDEAAVKKFEQQIPDIITKVVNELATRWASKPDQLREELRLAGGGSLYLLESTESWKKALAASLTKDQVKDWHKNFDARYQEETDRIERQKKVAEARAKTAELRAIQQQEAAQVRAIAEANRLVVIAGLLGPDQKAPLMTACRAGIERARTQAEKSLQKEAAWLASTYKLTEKQSRRLDLAIKGSQKKRFRAELAQMENLETQDWTDDNEEEFMEQLKQLFLSVQSAKTEHHGDPLWTKAVRSALGETQFAEYEREVSARAKFQREAEITSVILTIDKPVRLSIAQREQLRSALNEYSGPVTQRSGRAPTSYRSLPNAVREFVDNVLTVEQLEAVQKPTNRIPPGRQR